MEPIEMTVHMNRQSSSGMWLEYLLVIILIILLALAAYKLLGPFFKDWVIQFCTDYELPCGQPTEEVQSWLALWVG